MMNHVHERILDDLYSELEEAQATVRFVKLEIEALKNIPPSCVCDPREWGKGRVSDVGPVCAGFEPMEDDAELCRKCEHLAECHENPKTGEGEKGGDDE